jgi:hypothetical protein
VRCVHRLCVLRLCFSLSCVLMSCPASSSSSRGWSALQVRPCQHSALLLLLLLEVGRVQRMPGVSCGCVVCYACYWETHSRCSCVWFDAYVSKGLGKVGGVALSTLAEHMAHNMYCCVLL